MATVTDDGPGVFRLALGALLAIFVGALGGLFRLAAIPAEVVEERPPDEEIKPRVEYVVVGSSSVARSFRDKEQDFLAGQQGVFAFSESELNTWADESFEFEPPEGQTPEEEAEAEAGEDGEEPEAPSADVPFLGIRPSAPNFRLVGETLQILIRFEMFIAGNAYPVAYRTRGDFAIEGNRYRFRPLETTVGSAPLPASVLAPLLDQLVFKIFDSSEYVDQFNAAWASVTAITIAEDELVLSTEL